LAFASEEVYLKIIGLVLLMFGLYSSTRQWSSDNDKNTEDENELVKEEEDLETNEHPKENKEN
jgi:hypothetical protein